MEDASDVGATSGIRAMPVPMMVKKPSFASAVINLKEKYNWLIHMLFLK